MTKSVAQRVSIAFCSVLLVLLLAACGGTGATSSSAKSTTKTTPTVPPTPTAAAMQTYTGTGFSIGYPQGLTPKPSATGVAFADPTTGNMLEIVASPNPGGATSTASVASEAMSIYEKTFLSNAKSASVAPTATVGGESWVQLSATGTLTLIDAGQPGTLFLLADTHSGTMYQIIYFGPTSTFAQTNTMVFQPMLASFKFTA